MRTTGIRTSRDRTSGGPPVIQIGKKNIGIYKHSGKVIGT